MSLIRQTDVKNHLSARHRSGIHVVQPQSESDATGYAQRESSDVTSKVNDAIDALASSDLETTPTVPPKSAKA
jgi:hypothetical protein